MESDDNLAIKKTQIQRMKMQNKNKKKESKHWPVVLRPLSKPFRATPIGERRPSFDCAAILYTNHTVYAEMCAPLFWVRA